MIQMLDGMQMKFNQVTQGVLDRVDELGDRLDSLEATIEGMAEELKREIESED